jgi:hypothetical protein
LGLGLSTLCMIHCLALPVIFSLLPSLPLSGWLHEWTHPLFIALILPTLIAALRRSEHDIKVRMYLFSGFGVVVLGFGLGHYLLGESWESGLTIAGSVLLVIGHYRNYHHHRTCSNRHHHHHPELEKIAKE